VSKYVQTGTPKKTVGAYLKAVKALNELQTLGEDVVIHDWHPSLTGITGRIIQDDDTGEWSYVES
jgi:hypothetical protein